MPGHFTARAVTPLGCVLIAAALPDTAAAQSLTLFDAVDSAVAAHPALSAASARVTAAAEAGDVARAAWLPDASVSATLTRFEEPMIVAPLHALDFATPPRFDRALVQGRLGMEYTLFDGGARSSRIRAADAIHEGASEAERAARMGVLEQTTAAYVGVLIARAVLDAASAQVAALAEEHDRAQRQLAAGGAAELEELRAAAALQQARAEEASAAARVGLAERRLTRLMGVEPAAVEGQTLADVAPVMDRPAGQPGSSPVVLQADRAVAAAEARLAEQSAARFPSVHAGAGLLDYGTLNDEHVFEWQAGLEISWPIFTGGATSAAVDRARAELAAARSELEVARLETEHAVDAAETAVVESDAMAAALATAVSQWEEVARIEALAHAAGSGVQGDLLSAQAGLFQARAGHARARYDAVLARVQLARAEGVLDRSWMNASLEIR